MPEQPDKAPPSNAGPGDPGEFARQAAEHNAGLLSELLDLVLTHKKWWLIPVIVALLLIGVIVLLGTTAAAPFIYPLF